MPKFLNYQQTYEILHDRIMAKDIEVKYWARRNINTSSYKGDLMPFTSDLPDHEKNYLHPSFPFYQTQFDPTLCFFREKNVMEFSPPMHDRLVQVQELSARMWNRVTPSEFSFLSVAPSDYNFLPEGFLPSFSGFPALDRAAQKGILRFYDPETYQFTYYKKHKNSPDKLWYYTAEGEKYLSGETDHDDHVPEKFFLLHDIVNIERIFFNRPRDECLRELGFDPNDEDFQ